MLNDSTGTGVKGMNIIRTFFSLINEEVPENDKNAISYLGLWNKNYWPVGLSSFVINCSPIHFRLRLGWAIGIEMTNLGTLTKGVAGAPGTDILFRLVRPLVIFTSIAQLLWPC